MQYVLVFDGCVVDVNPGVNYSGNCRPMYPDDVVFCVDAPNFKALQHSSFIAHVTGHFLAFRWAHKLAATSNGAWTTVSFGNASMLQLTFKVPSLYYPLEAPVAGLSPAIHIVAGTKVTNIQGSSRRKLGVRGNEETRQLLFRWYVGLVE